MVSDGGVRFSNALQFLRARVAAGIFVHQQRLVRPNLHLLLIILKNKRSLFLKTYHASEGYPAASVSLLAIFL